MASTRLVLALTAAVALTACAFRTQRALLHVPAHEPPAPAVYDVTFTTTKGPFVIEVHRDWAPLGADRFYDLARHGYYDGGAFFRVIPKFMAQFGLSPDPRITAAWANANLPDDSVIQSNTRGRIAFADSGPNSRTTEVFINFGNNARLDKLGFAPFGEVVAGMDVVDSLDSEYGEAAPRGHGPDHDRIAREGAPYLEKEFPRLDRILSTHVRHP